MAIYKQNICLHVVAEWYVRNPLNDPGIAGVTVIFIGGLHRSIGLNHTSFIDPVGFGRSFAICIGIVFIAGKPGVYGVTAIVGFIIRRRRTDKSNAVAPVGYITLLDKLFSQIF